MGLVRVLLKPSHTSPKRSRTANSFTLSIGARHYTILQETGWLNHSSKLPGGLGSGWGPSDVLLHHLVVYGLHLCKDRTGVIAFGHIDRVRRRVGLTSDLFCNCSFHLLL